MLTLNIIRETPINKGKITKYTLEIFIELVHGNKL